MKETVERIVNNVLSDKGLELVDIVHQSGGKRPVIRVFIDRPEGGITIDECATVNRALNVQFLVEESIPDNTIVEVSSPGMERPLRTHRDFLRNLNHPVDIYYTSEDGRSFSATGVLAAVDDVTVTLRSPKGEKVILRSAIVNAKPRLNF